MGKFFNKLRQVFNIFLLSALIAAVTAVFVYFLTSPEQRGTTFWISIAFLAVAFVFETLTASGIAMRGNNGKNVPVGFSKFILGGIYFLFVIVMSVGNALYPFTVTKYLLIHIAGLAVFLIPMIFMNMAELRLSGSDRKQQDEGHANLSALASRVGYVAQDLKASGDVSQITRLADSLKYSDPTPASGKLERALDEAIDNLEGAAKSGNLDEVLRMCTLAERALQMRNDYVKNAK